MSVDFVQDVIAELAFLRGQLDRALEWLDGMQVEIAEIQALMGRATTKETTT